MTALISWLDASPDEQRRVREIVQLFSQKETQDELGGRRIVVALSDLLFPGTSVLHSRARYLFFIPWFCQEAVAKKDPAAHLDWMERYLIKVFLDEQDLPPEQVREGLIGLQAGPKVKQLPSTAYWTALIEWGLLQWPGTIAQTLERARFASHDANDVDELADRSHAIWHPGLGRMPKGFLYGDLHGGFELTNAEAVFLQEQWLKTARGSLLEHLARSRQALSEAEPWTDPAVRTASPQVIEVLDDAERFSLAIDGARRLYYLLIGERYLQAGHTRAEIDLDDLRKRLDDWAVEVRTRADLFGGWEPASFWNRVRGENARIDHVTQAFFDVWFDRIRQDDLDGVAADDGLRQLVKQREQFLKRGQARLVNEKLLAGWQGGAAGRVTYRWPQVSRLVNDVVEGLDAGA